MSKLKTNESRHSLKAVEAATLQSNEVSQTVNCYSPESAQQSISYSRNLGICVTCMHQPRCLFVRAARLPIQFCDEFDDNGPASSEPEKPILDSRNTTGQGFDPGICTNCEERLGCMHREPGVTTISCEDYR